MNDTFLFSRRTNWPLESNKLTVDVECLRNQNISILDLTESNPTRCEFSYPREGVLKSLLEESNLDYRPSSRGYLKAREAVSEYYKERGSIVPPDRIFLTASTSEAYSYLFRLLCNPSDHVLFPQPSYPLFSFLGNLNDVRMENYPLVYDGKWHIDLLRTQDLFCDDTRAFVLVNPNNPTGSFVQVKELDQLNNFCKERNTALICDEVFADFALDTNRNHVSLVDNDQTLTFILGGISKTLGLPQMKLSWIVVNGPQGLVDRAISRLDVIADTYLSVNTPTQNALSKWLPFRGEIQKDMIARIKRNYSYLQELVKQSKDCELLSLEGGWYAILKIPDTYGEEEWTLAFLNHDHVLVHPGYFFDFEHEAYIVLSLLTPDQVFQEGSNRIVKRISKGEL